MNESKCVAAEHHVIGFRRVDSEAVCYPEYDNAIFLLKLTLSQ